MKAEQLSLFPHYPSNCGSVSVVFEVTPKFGRVLSPLQRSPAREPLLSLQSVERLLRKGKGDVLLLTALSYDLGVQMPSLCTVKVRDVNLSRRRIFVRSREFVISPEVFDELRDYIHDRLCGLEATVSADKREEVLFPQETLCAADALLSSCAISRQQLRASGRVHLRRAIRRGCSVTSPLGLMDRGPRIVRRGPGGAISGCYVWRGAVSF
jgi:hypothetical protein